MNTPLEQTPSTAINDVLKQFADKSNAQRIIAAEVDEAAQIIRSSTVDAVIAFIDMVGSTEYKQKFRDVPEQWIVRLKLFCEVVQAFVIELGGRVVKYIGDELMVIFDNDARINNSLSLALRAEDIERELYNVIGQATQIKITIDCGAVYMLRLDGHTEYDPQGTPVDRCARISKYAEASTVLASSEYVSRMPIPEIFEMLGEDEMKGLGSVVIFERKPSKIKFERRISVIENEYMGLLDDRKAQLLLIDQLKKNANALELKNEELMSELVTSGTRTIPIASPDSGDADDNTLWDRIEEDIASLKQVIYESDVYQKSYARFLFLYMSGQNESISFENGENIAELIEHKLIGSMGLGNSEFSLNLANRHNKRAIRVLEELEEMLSEYESSRGEDDGDAFDYSLNDPAFWQKYVGFRVS